MNGLEGVLRVAFCRAFREVVLSARIWLAAAEIALVSAVLRVLFRVVDDLGAIHLPENNALAIGGFPVAGYLRR